jgi:hypothetical protein
VTRVGFEPTPMKTTALTLRLRPLGHRVMFLSLYDTSKIIMFNLYLFSAYNFSTKPGKRMREKAEQKKSCKEVCEWFVNS